YLHVGTEQAPEYGEFFNHRGIGAGRRRENAPPVHKKLGEARIGTRVLGASDRVGRYKMYVLRQMRGHIAHDRAFYRADIGDDGPGQKMRPDLLGTRPARASRN